MQNQNLATDILGVSKDVAASTGQITATVQALNLSARDSTDRNSHAINQSINSTGQIIQNGVERTAATTQSGIERTAGGIQASVASVIANSERIAGENRTTTLQTNSDTREQSSAQTRDILTLVNGTSFENRLSLSTNFASLLAEQEKNRQYLSHQLSENKYEDLKNHHMVISQLADIKTQNAVLMAESKYEALKTQCAISAQLASSTCDIKNTIKDLDEARIRDDLNRARIINELRNHNQYGNQGFYNNGYGNGFNGVYGNGNGNFGGSVANGFGFSLGESIFNRIVPATTPAV
jgi:hypothetical protein